MRDLLLLLGCWLCSFWARDAGLGKLRGRKTQEASVPETLGWGSGFPEHARNLQSGLRTTTYLKTSDNLKPLTQKPEP